MALRQTFFGVHRIAITSPFVFTAEMACDLDSNASMLDSATVAIGTATAAHKRMFMVSLLKELELELLHHGLLKLPASLLLVASSSNSFTDERV